MTDTFRALVAAVERDVRGPRHQRIFDVVRARQPVLETYPDVAAVLEALSLASDEDYADREALTRALLHEHRQGTSTLWASVLVVAYYPMLSRLRHRLTGDVVPREERDQVVLTAFLAALRYLPVGGPAQCVALRLRRRTARGVFRFLRRQRQPSQAVRAMEELGPDAVALGLVPGGTVTMPDEACEAAQLLARLRARPKAKGGVAIVIATMLRPERLRSVANRVGGDDAQERERAYQRLKRQRSRTLHRMKSLGQVSPFPGPAAFVSGAGEASSAVTSEPGVPSADQPGEPS